MPRGSASERQARCDGAEQRESERVSIDLNRFQARHEFGNECGQQFHTDDRHRQPTNAPEACQRHALRQQLPYESKTPRTQRGADGQFLLALLGPCQDKICHVGANDEQHEYDGCYQCEKGSLQIVAPIGELVTRRTHPQAQPAGPAIPFLAIRFVECLVLRQTLRDRVEHRFRLPNGDARLESRVNVDVWACHPPGRQTKRLRRKPEFGATPRKLKMRRHHANDGEVTLAHLDGFSDGVRIAAEQRLPPRIAEHDDRVLRWFLLLVDRHRFVFGKSPAQQRRHVPECKEIRRNHVAAFFLDEVLGLSLQTDLIGPRELGEE